MRTVVNISMPAVLKKEIERETREGGYMSVSEFFRAVMRERKMNQILQDVEDSRRECRVGKASVLRSLKDLR
jgi:Arc/MetJ-type ribon-helix-helix transcriptional regulator